VADREQFALKLLESTNGTVLGTFNCGLTFGKGHGVPFGVRTLVFGGKDLLFVAAMDNPQDHKHQKIFVLDVSGLNANEGVGSACRVVQTIEVDANEYSGPHLLGIDESNGDVYAALVACDMKRLERAVCQLRPPLLKEEGRRGGDYDSMMEIGFKCVNIVSQFALACSDVYRKNEHFIFSGGGDGDVTSSMEEKQLLIVKVTSTFRRWKSVLHQVELKRHQWYETFFSQFDDDDEQEGSGIGEIENKDDDEYTLALEQHNQIILAAITQAASDIVRNIGAIGESLEGVWLLK
jgi:hypothetical protein